MVGFINPYKDMRAARLLEAKGLISPFDAMEMRLDALARKRVGPTRKAS